MRKYFTKANKAMIRESMERHYSSIIQYRFGDMDYKTGLWKPVSCHFCLLSAVMLDNEVPVRTDDFLADIGHFLGVDKDTLWGFIRGFDETRELNGQAYEFGKEMQELRRELCTSIV